MKSFTTDGDFTQNYKFLIGSILPRPIAVVSTLSENGSVNVAPFSFFTAVSAKPMIIAFSPLIRSSTGLEKDTPLNIVKNGEFVVNFVTEATAEKVNATSQELEYGESELEVSGLSTLPSTIIKTPRIAESPVHFECKFRDRLVYGDQPGAGQIITGEVVMVHVDESLLEDGKISTDLFKPVGRGAGQDWIKTTDRFQLDRLMKRQIQK